VIILVGVGRGVGDEREREKLFWVKRKVIRPPFA
jgi:hypothetical protein